MFFDNLEPKKIKPKVIQIDADPINSDWINPDRDSSDSDIECQIFPLGHFGDHDLGYSGCTFCKQQKECIEKNPNIGKSLIITKPKSKRFKRR